MAGIVEFGQRQKQKKEKETTPALESGIDNYLEEMEEKEELLSEIDFYAERAILEYGLDVPGFHLNDRSVRRFMSAPLESMKKDPEVMMVLSGVTGMCTKSQPVLRRVSCAETVCMEMALLRVFPL